MTAKIGDRGPAGRDQEDLISMTVKTIPHVDLPDWLALHGFAQNQGGWWERGAVRVVIDDSNVLVHCFEKPGGLLLWSASFSNLVPSRLIWDAVDEAFGAPAENVIAGEIQRMLALRAKGHLKPSGDDFISGLVKAYALAIGTDDQDYAVARAQAVVIEGAQS